MDTATPKEPLYRNHPGSITVSGRTEVGKASRYLVYLLQENIRPIEVVFIGGNAGQQAYKICAVASLIAFEELSREIAFVTKKVLTRTKDRDLTGKVKMEDGKPKMVVKDAFIWQAIELPEGLLSAARSCGTGACDSGCAEQH